MPGTHVTGQNVFTDVVTDTTRGGVNISERTPLSGDGFGAFPLYKITKGIPYPTPPPLECNANKCLFMNNTDMATGDRVAFYNSSSLEDCCSKCQVCHGVLVGVYRNHRAWALKAYVPWKRMC